MQRTAAAGGLFVLPVLTACTTDDDDGDDLAGGTAGEDTDGDDGLPVWEYDGPPGPDTLFEHGVASGDPLPDAVILWTHASAEEDAALDVFVEVALDPEFADRVAAETYQALPERGFTLKVDLQGLTPGTTYYYRFYAMDRISPIGRTRTAPEGEVEQVRLGVYSCSSLAHGWLHGLAQLGAQADLDAIVCLGDYIYEYGNDEFGSVRPYEPPFEITTLEDYRTRYSQYRREAELAEAHRQHPFIAVWDDHEVADNSWRDGAENHQDAVEGDYAERKAAAQQAYDEWMPLRTTAPEEIYRTLRYGDLLDLIMLDTRHVGRDEVDGAATDDESRSLLGFDQEAWLEGELSASTAAWRVLGQQVVMGQWLLTADTFLNSDSWDGYRAARNRLYAYLRDEGIDNVVVLTGDVHSSWIFDLTESPLDTATYDPGTGEGSVGVEFVAPGMTSANAPLSPDNLMTTNPQLHWGDATRRGYFVLDVTRDRVHADYFLLDDEVVESPDGGEAEHASAWAVDAGTAHAVEAEGPLPPLAQAPPLAP